MTTSDPLSALATMRIGALADWWRSMCHVSHQEAATRLLFRASEAAIRVEDYDRAIAMFRLAEHSFSEDELTMLFLEIAGLAPHGSEPDLALHRRCVDGWWRLVAGPRLLRSNPCACDSTHLWTVGRCGSASLVRV